MAQNTEEGFNLFGIRGFGTYVLQYRFKDKLYALSLLDILPHYVSSVYFSYDTTFSNLTLGIFSMLFEVRLSQLLGALLKTPMYHTSGYYMANCPKMAYKANLEPSFLLCPYTFTWVPFKACSEGLDLTKHAKLCERDVIDPPCGEGLPCTNVKRNNQIIQVNINEFSKLQGFIELVGPILSQRIIVCYIKLMF